MTLLKTIYTSILTCETWVTTSRQINRIHTSEVKYLRRLENVTLRDKISNEIMRQNPEAKSL